MRSNVSLLVAALILTAGFAGCLGGSNPPAPKKEAPPTTNATSNTTMDPAMGNVDASDVNKSAGAVAHTHDYWRGRERVNLMDSDINISAGNAIGFTFFNTFRGTPGVGGANFNLPEEQIVYEGTGKMEITMTWTDPTVTGTGLSWRTPASPSTFSPAKDMKSGNSLVVDITPEMCDMPHAKNSQWTFLAMPDSAGQVVYGKIHVKIDIIRMRDITMFPPHPDFWKGAHELTVFKGDAQSTQHDAANQIVGFATKQNMDTGVKATGMVPMETIVMTANLTVTSVTGADGKVTNVFLLVKPANSNGYATVKPQHVDTDKNLYQYSWLVDMRMADGAYAKESAWKFDVQVAADPTGQGTQLCSQGACTDAQVNYHLEVLADDHMVDGAQKLQGGRGGG